MKRLEEIMKLTPEEAVKELKAKSVSVRPWAELLKEYDPKRHPVMDKGLYPDTPTGKGMERVTRITYDLQRLAVKRMSELVCGVPVKRLYTTEGDTEERLSRSVEAVFKHNRIDALNVERTTMLFASCEVFTLWYMVEGENELYGFKAPNKIRCRNFSPMNGYALYPLFDEGGDLIAMSVQSVVKRGEEKITYLDTYTDTAHLRYVSVGDEAWMLEAEERHEIGKIAGVYIHRPTPIWEDTSPLVYEMEWAMSRNGNYLRRNSKPILCINSEADIRFGDEAGGTNEARSILLLPQGATASYVTWGQAVDNLKYYISELKQSFFSQLQIPDWSYESIKSTPMSGEARKQLFIDAHLKVRDESGRLMEAFSREVNVVKALLQTMLPAGDASALERVSAEIEITPYTIDDEKTTIQNLALAVQNGLTSQREAIQMLGWSDDPEETLREILEEQQADGMEASY